MAMTEITVTVDDDHLDRIDELATTLRDNGMQVDQVLDTIGIIFGSAPQERHQVLKDVPGVQSVEGVDTFKLPPPESEVQ